MIVFGGISLIVNVIILGASLVWKVMPFKTYMTHSFTKKGEEHLYMTVFSAILITITSTIILMTSYVVVYAALQDPYDLLKAVFGSVTWFNAGSF